jgi:hypothetical protein
MVEAMELDELMMKGGEKKVFTGFASKFGIGAERTDEDHAEMVRFLLKHPASR